jgi:miniconductance mechanosensitive channel
MTDSGGRRIKRSIYIDQHSVHFLSPEETERLSRIPLIAGYMQSVAGKQLTNLGTFRAYADAYIQSVPARAPDLTCMARYLQPDENGLQLEFYLFCRDKAWVNYERVQADILDHLLAMLGEFALSVYQRR